MTIEWPSSISSDDAVIVPADLPGGMRYVVHGHGVPQFECRTYVEAESRAASYAERTRTHVWLIDANGPRLVRSFSGSSNTEQVKT